MRKTEKEVFDEAIKFAIFLVCPGFSLLFVCFMVTDDEKDTLYCLVFERLHGFSPVSCDFFLMESQIDIGQGD